VERWKIETITEAIDDLIKARVNHNVEEAVSALKRLEDWLEAYLPKEVGEDE
jgi:hypothetical protein